MRAIEAANINAVNFLASDKLSGLYSIERENF